MEGLISKHRAGAAIVMDVHDGSILAAVSLPQFDPNTSSRGIEKAEWDALSAAEDKPLFNRFVTATYPPGSTLKVVSTYRDPPNHVVNPDAVLVVLQRIAPLRQPGVQVLEARRARLHGALQRVRAVRATRTSSRSARSST